jgi:glucose 1-dehydrogenase
MYGHPPAGRTVLVTGASSGIGRASALAFGATGANVIVNYLDDRDAADSVAAGIEQAGGKALALQANVAVEDEVMTMFEQAGQAFGPLHVLVNNAGIQKDSPTTSMTIDQWHSVLETNLTGAFLCARQAARQFSLRGDSNAGAKGNIVFISSVHDLIPWQGRVNYAASKGGISMLMKSLAQELGPAKVRVNAVAPGAIKTDINRDSWETDAAEQDLLTLIPYGRVGDPDDVARAVVWLASDDSDYVHGHTLYIDGGMTLYPGFSQGG